MKTMFICKVICLKTFGTIFFSNFRSGVGCLGFQIFTFIFTLTVFGQHKLCSALLPLKRQSRLQQTTFINIFSLFLIKNKT